ncbi:MAG: SMP-30/gluconolactonase/LRE family protein [Prolixibacteraceae bacterium]|jgi:gluconolactonase|nr:SMP-30/gluconolactonase/LRE family protein [Prolixibacteraceae bacterium]
MRKILLLLLVAGSLSALAIDPDPIQKLIVKGEKITKAGGGYTFTEGPSVAADGRVFFTDQPNDKIEVWSENGSITTFMQGGERSNGTYFNKKGELVVCADLHNRLIAISMGKQTRILAESFNGTHLNGPNDLWIAPNGGIYFSDPYYFREYWETGHKELQDHRGVYYLSPEGTVTRVIGDYKQPNGLIGTPDGKILYVSDINDRKIWKYTINPDGSLGSKTLFAPEGSDGMTIDNLGNVYLTNKSVSVYSRKGEHIGRIEVPEEPSNLCFGGKKRDILFITARTSVYTLKMKVVGK